MGKTGFAHSAFTFRMEAHLEHSPNLSKHIPRGQIIELLSKALLYMEVEMHWRGDALAVNCKRPFSLLDPHECSPDVKPRKFKSANTSAELGSNASSKEKTVKTNGTAEESNKRKAGVPSSVNQPIEKRARKDSREMSVDPYSSLTESKFSSSPQCHFTL